MYNPEPNRADYSREWAIIVPCYLMVIVLLTYLSYAALTAWHTPSFDSLSLITGESSLRHCLCVCVCVCGPLTVLRHEQSHNGRAWH